jgi:hypothetical protein
VNLEIEFMRSQNGISLVEVVLCQVSRPAYRALFRLLGIACLVAGTCCLAWSQASTGTLGGRVTDPGQHVVAGADVTVISEETGVETHARTNDAGLWQVSSLVAGHYRFRVTAQGFATVEHSAIDLQIEDVKSVDVQMKVGSVSEQVVVSAETPLIDTTAAVSGTVLTTAQLEELPSATNAPTELVVLAPGVFQAPPSGGGAYLWSTNSESSVTVNASGSGNNAVNYVIDGATNSIVSNGQIAYIPPMDSVAEVRVTTSAYDASIGRTAAGTVNLSLKSGTDAFHGVLYERNQNNFLNADYIQYKATGQPTPTIHFNEYGGTIGGPVLLPKIYNGRKHGTFFFFSYDGIRNTSPAGTGFLSIPTQAERNGDFSSSFEVVNGVSYPITIYDPLTINPATGNRQTFPGAIIPQDRISPMAKEILSLMPLPNVPHTAAGTDANDYLENDPKVDRFYSWSARVDQAWNNNHHSYIEWRRNQLREQTGDPFGPGNILIAEDLNRDNYGLTLDHSWVVNPKVIVSLNLNATAYKTTDGSHGATLDPTKYGFSQNFANSQPHQGLPELTGALGTSIGDTVGPLYENDYEWEGHGFITHIVGPHTLRYGAEYLLQQEAAGNLAGETGVLNFSGVWTSPNPNTTAPAGADAVNPSFLLGLPSSGSISTNATAFWTQPFTGAYMQDDWRVTPNLTLDLGLRWDIQLSLTERHDRYFARFDPNANIAPVTNYAQPLYANLIGGAATNTGIALLQKYGSPVSDFQARGAIEYAGLNGTKRSLTDLQYKYFQPRVGFAWQFAPHSVLRGGAGRFVQANFVANHANQLGYSATTPYTASNDNYYTSAATLDSPFPNGLVAPTGNSLGALTSIGSVSSFYTSDVKRQYTDDVSLRLQQQVHDYLFEIAGVFERTSGLVVGYQIDNPSLAAWHAAFDPQFDSTGRPVDTLPGNVQVPNPFKGAPYITTSLKTNSTVTAYQLVRPNPLINGVTENLYTGTSTHYALQARVERHFRDGFGISSNFSWGKQMDSTGYFTPSVYSQALHRVVSPNDRKFQFVASPTYILPFGQGRLIGRHVDRVVDEIIGGWEVSAIYNFYSGTPLTLPTNTAFFEGGDPAAGISKSKTQWFNTSRFRAFPNRSTTVQQIASYPAWTGVQGLPGSGWSPTTSSDLSKNGVYNDFNTWISNNPTTFGTVRNPYLNNWNIGIRKNFPIHDALRLQLRIDAFNAFNHPQLGNVDTTPTDTYFGWIGGSPVPSQVNTPRQIQLEGKLYF